MPTTSTICLLIVCHVLVSARAIPQLDLPPLSAPQSDIYYSSNYGASTNRPVPLRQDEDRSQRYGPPYAEENTSNDAVDDYRLGQTYMYDERNRYGSNYPLTGVQNFTRDTPFSDRNHENARFRNHNYENPADRFRDRYADNYNERAQGLNNDINTYRSNQEHYGVNSNPYSTPGPNSQNYPNENSNPYSTPFPSHNPNPYSTPFPSQNPNPYSTPFPSSNPNPYSTPYPLHGNYPFDNNNHMRNEDRFNLNDREHTRDRFRQDRRFQIEIEKLRNFLVETDHKGSLECNSNVAAQWNFETNVNDFTQAEAVSIQNIYPYTYSELLFQLFVLFQLVINSCLCLECSFDRFVIDS